jgi:hypothetical protein
MEDISGELVTVLISVCGTLGVVVGAIVVIMKSLFKRHLIFLDRLETNIQLQTESASKSEQHLAAISQANTDNIEMHRNIYSPFATVLTNDAIREFMEAQKLVVQGAPDEQVLAKLDKGISILDSRKR